MLIIRREQMEAFRRLEREHYVEERCAHLQRFFPHKLGHFAAHELRGWVSRTLDRASQYGLTTRRACGHFLDLAATFGGDFDTRPENAWVADWLTDPEVGEPAERIRVVVEHALRLLRTGAMQPSDLAPVTSRGVRNN